MTEPQHTLDNFAESNSNEPNPKNGEADEHESESYSENDDQSASPLPNDSDYDQATSSNSNPADNSNESQSQIRSKSELKFGKDPEEIDIPSMWASRYISHRSADTLKKKPLSESSIGPYTSILREYVNFLADHDRDVLSAEFERFEDYLLFCINIGRRTSTAMVRVSVIRGLYEHIELNENVNAEISPIEFDQIQRDAIEELTPEDIQREYLTREELKKLFDAMKRNRDRLMVIVATETGFRNSDIREIRIIDVDFDEPEIYAKNPKNGNPYSVPISEELALELEIFIEGSRKANYGHIDSKFLFPSERSEKLHTNDSLRSLVHDAAKRAGIQGVIGSTEIESKYLKQEKIDRTWYRVIPHILRHSFITILENEGVPLEYRRLLANHSSTETTRRYSHGKKELLKEAQQRINIHH